MKNRLSDLNDHLFAQLERLSEEGISADKIEAEVNRTKAIVDVAGTIIDNARLAVQAAKLIAEHGDRFAASMPMIAPPDPGSGSEKPRQLIKAAGT